MTPTNDAPVTVEQLLAWMPQPDDRVEALLLAEASRRDASDWNREDAKNVIAFLLAALASAPAVPAVPAVPTGMKPWRGGEAAPDDWDGGEVLLENGEMGDGNVWDHHPSRSPARIVAYTPVASAPAGDGVPDGWQLVPTEPTETMLHAVYLCGDGGSPKAAYEAMLAAAPAALARPRAAVGERTAILAAVLRYDHDRANIMGVGSGSFHKIRNDFVDAILALQTPPAKVEGE